MRQKIETNKYTVNSNIVVSSSFCHTLSGHNKNELFRERTTGKKPKLSKKHLHVHKS